MTGHDLPYVLRADGPLLTGGVARPVPSDPITSTTLDVPQVRHDGVASDGRAVAAEARGKKRRPWAKRHPLFLARVKRAARLLVFALVAACGFAAGGLWGWSRGFDAGIERGITAMIGAVVHQLQSLPNCFPGDERDPQSNG